MNNLIVFNNIEFGNIRIIEIDNEPWFVGKEVAEILGYERPTKAVQDHVDNEDKDAIPIQDSIGRMQNTPIINESGLYSLILSSKLPNAKKFKVLPSLRKTGSYSMKAVVHSDLSAKSQALRCPQFWGDVLGRQEEKGMNGIQPLANNTSLPFTGGWRILS